MDYKQNQFAPKLPFILRSYQFLSHLGSGGKASVFKVLHLSSQKTFAAKVILNNPADKAHTNSIKSEIVCLMKCYHPNIIKIYDYFREGDYIFMIIELCEKGSLKTLIRQGIQFSERQTLHIMKEILIGIEYCHTHGIAHRDIKPDNIFASNDGFVKIGDFGLGFNLDKNKTSKNFSGSTAFKAPEIIKMKEYSPELADVWSLGVTFFVLATGDIPWIREHPLMEEMIINGCYTIPSTVPQSISQVIKAMLIINPNQRPTLQQLLQFPCFESINPAPINVFMVRQRIPLCVRSNSTRPTIKESKSVLSKGGFHLCEQSKYNCTSCTKLVLNIKPCVAAGFSKTFSTIL